MAVRSELFTTEVTLNKKTYFFNVKENRSGDVFLQVVESKKGEGQEFDRYQISVFAEDMQNFLKGLEQSLSFIEKDKKEKAKKAREKKALKEAKYGKSSTSSTKKVIRKRKSNDEDEVVIKHIPQVKKTGKVHVVSKRNKDN